MTTPTPIGDNAPGYAPGGYSGGAEPAPYTPYTPHGEPPPPPSGEPTLAYTAPPPQYPPYPPPYQPYQGEYQPGAAPAHPGYLPQRTPGMNHTNAFAIASFVCSLAGILLGGFLGIVSIIFGHIALGQIKRSNGYERGHGYAVAGLIIGYVELALALIGLIILLLALFLFSLPIPTGD